MYSTLALYTIINYSGITIVIHTDRTLVRRLLAMPLLCCLTARKTHIIEHGTRVTRTHASGCSYDICLRTCLMAAGSAYA